MTDESRTAPTDLSDLMSRGHRLRVDAATAEIFDRFDGAGIQAVLLKGRSIFDWLYSASEIRRQGDCDLLVAPSHLADVEAVLASLGYRRDWDDRRMPSWWREHAGEWRRDRDHVVVDVHRTLVGIGAVPEKAWEALSRDAVAVTVAGREVPALPIPARAFQIALHAAQHGTGPTAPLEDLRRALRAGDLDVWRAAAQLAYELNAVDAYTAGLRLDPDGKALAQQLHLPERLSTRANLHASSPPPVALGVEQLLRTPGVGAKLAIITRKLFPPPEFIRHWEPQAGASRSALLKAYVRRPLWLLAKAPLGIRAWTRAYRVTRDGTRRSWRR